MFDVGLSSEFWAAIVGALVGGGMSAALQVFANRSATKVRLAEANAHLTAQARSLVLKTVKIESDFLQFRKDLEESIALAKQNGIPFGWRAYRAAANLPREIIFTNDEIAALSACKNDDLFNDVLALDEVHSSVLQIMSLYRTKRFELSDSLPAKMSGSLGTSALTQDEFNKLAPKMAQVDLLANDLASLIEVESSQPMGLSKRLVTAFNDRYGGNMSIELKQRP